MSPTISSRQAAITISILAVLQLIIQISLLGRGTEYLTASLVIDDTYYYLQSAWNAKLLGFVTFDGLHATNGVQMLWFLIILLLAMLAQSKLILLFMTLTVGFLLNALCYIAIIKIGAAVKQPMIALIMASLWALQSLPFRIYSMGMENSLHAFVYWCALWQAVEFLIRVRNREKPNFWSLTVVLILNAWTRMDSALLSAVLFSFCVGMLAYTYRSDMAAFVKEYGKTIAASSILAVIGLALQLAAFWIMGNSILPVSALVKTSGAGRGADVEPLEKFVELFTLGMPSILQGRFSDAVLIAMGISGMLFVILLGIYIRDHTDELRALLDLWYCLLVGETIYHVYIMFSEVEYSAYFIWYRSPTFIFGIITASLVAIFFLTAIGRFVKRNIGPLRWAPAALSLFICVLAVGLFARSISFASKLYVARYHAALWIAENSPPETIYASWNAGQLGFFSDRTVINLDGVINSVDYYERVLRGTTSLPEYLIENNVDFVVDYDTYGAIPDLPVIQSFPINDGSGRSIHIWRVTPEVLSQAELN